MLDADGNIICTPLQERLAQNIVSGRYKAAWEAGIAAGYCAANATQNVSKAVRLPHVQRRIAELRARSDSALVATIIERKIKLTEIMDGKIANVSPTARIAAIHELNLMEGVYEALSVIQDNRQINFVVVYEGQEGQKELP